MQESLSDLNIMACSSVFYHVYVACKAAHPKSSSTLHSALVMIKLVDVTKGFLSMLGVFQPSRSDLESPVPASCRPTPNALRAF